MSDRWLDASSRLQSALGFAFEAGMTMEEVQDCVSEVFDPKIDTIERPPKPQKGNLKGNT